VTSERSLLLRLIGDARSARGLLSAAALAIALLGAAQLYLTWLVKRLVEGPMRTGDAAALRQLALEGLAVVLVAAVALAVSRYAVAAANQRLVEQLRHRAAARLLTLPVPSARAFASGDLMARLLADAALLSNFLGTVVRRALREVIVAGGAFALLFVLEWKLALAGCLIVPAAAFLISRYGRRIRRASAGVQGDLGRLGALLSEQIAGLTTVKGLRAEAYELARFDAGNAMVRRRALVSERHGAILNGVVFALTGVALVAIVLWGSTLIAGQAVNEAVILVFGLYAAQTVEPIRRLSDLHAMMQTSLASAARLYEIIDAEPEPPGGALALPAAAARSIELADVWFEYGADRPVLSGLSCHIAAGEQVALVGPSGAGKSTLGALLVGFRHPDRGEIRVDGVPQASLSIATIRSAIVLAEQDPFLFSGTLRDNICYAIDRPDDSAVTDAVRMAGLERFVSGLPRGLDTTVAEAGRQLSGGERQRLAIAPWLARRTVIAISHRLSTVARFPRILVLSNGRVASDGPLDAALRAGSVGAELFGDQTVARAAV
jgi:ATP-binding cassette subfamily B protein